MGAALELPHDRLVTEPEWAAQPGPQTQFATCTADIAIFGGAAGGGKSYALLLEAAKWVKVPGVTGYRAVVFRRKTTDLTGSGGLWDESQPLYQAFSGRPRAAPTLDWTFTSPGSLHRIEFRHLQLESDVYSHNGKQYAFIGFDELPTFTAFQFWYLTSRLRSVCGVRPYIRATCNPDPDSFVFELVRWWIGEDGYAIPERSGVVRWFFRRGDDLVWFETEAEAWAAVQWSTPGGATFGTEEEAKVAAPDGAPVVPNAVPKSFTFIASKLSDNPALTDKDPDYRGVLLALPRVQRERLLGDEAKGGNWLIREGAGTVFRRSEFKLVDQPPAPVLATVRFWDKAASEPTAKHPNPDWTRGVRMSLCEGGLLWIDDLVSMQKRGTDVLLEMRKTAEADTVAVTVGLWQDTGGAGKTDIDTTLTALAGFPVEVIDSHSADTAGLSGKHRSSRAKRAFANAWAPKVESGRVYVKRGPWANILLSEADNFPDARFDDIVDSISGGYQVLVGSGFSWWETIRAAAR